MSEDSRKDTLLETGQASYSDFHSGGSHDADRPKRPSRRSPRGVSYREPSDSDLDPDRGGVAPVSPEQRAINRAGIDGVMKALEEAELRRATSEEERNRIIRKWEADRQARADLRGRQDAGERIVL